MSEQVPFKPSFPDTTLVENTEPRCPVVLLVDTSGSMAGAPIDELNEGLRIFKESLMTDSLAQKRVEIAIVSFGSTPTVIQDFVTADLWATTTLISDGQTALGAATSQAIQMVGERKAKYKAAGVSYYRPWIFLFTDGAPTDAWEHLPGEVHGGESGKKFMFFSVGVGSNADMGVLSRIAPPSRPPLRMKGLAFREMFQWLSASLSSVSKSRVDETAPLPAPTGWGSTT